jgi:hypothetical protein
VKPRLDLLQERRRGPLPPDVGSLRRRGRVGQSAQHGLRQPVGEVGQHEVAHHHRGGQQGRGRVGDAAAGDVGGDCRVELERARKR